MAKTRKKIAVVVPKYGLVGGGEGFAAELSARMANDFNYDIHVFANKWIANSDKITFHKVPIFTFPKWLTTISFAWFANKKIENIGGFDLIHTHERIFQADICSMHFVPHRFWAKEVRKKKIFSLFDYATIWVEEKMFEKGRCFFMPVSSIAQQKMMEYYPVAQESQQVVFPGIGKDGQKDATDCRLEIRVEFGVKDEDFLILFVAMNFELKGLDLLLAAIALIKENSSFPKIKLLVVGRGNEDKFKQLATSLGIANKVIFTGVRPDMARIYQAGDLFVLLSGFDTFGMVVSEAMAASLPVIVSDMVGAKDLVQNKKNGFVVDRHDVGFVASCIEQLLADSAERARMGVMAKSSIENCTWDYVAGVVAQQYENICDVQKGCR